MPNRKLQIFISSTYKDLVEDRQAAVAAILKAGHIPAGMELFTAGDQSQWETITRWIDESDIFMLILGARYGSTHPDSGVGYTEMEYDYAVSMKKPYFAVVIHEDAIDVRVKLRGKEILELEHPTKLAGFRSKVLDRMATFFSEPKDIRLAVFESIRGLEQRYSLVGWVSGAEFGSNKPLADELAKLAEENRVLRSEISSLRKQLNTKSQTEEFEELRTTLATVKFSLKEFKDEYESLPDSIDLASLFYYQVSSFSTGLTNESGISSFDRFLYFNVAPKLEVHDLVENEKVPSVRWRQFRLTSRGKRFLAYIETMLAKSRSQADSLTGSVQGGVLE